jgi:hypothetical protein
MTTVYKLYSLHHTRALCETRDGNSRKIFIIMFLLIFALSGCKERGKKQEGTIL